MVFSSYLFLFYFLPLTLAVYYASPRSLRMSVLTILSYAFYGWTNPLYVPLMWISTAIDYIAGRVIVAEAQRRGLPLSEPFRTKRQRAALWLSVCSNLSLLAYFKYSSFAVSTYQSLITSWGDTVAPSDIVWQVALPLGISFYTFQSLSYTIDVYRGQARPAGSFLEFACFVSLFPQLVAGPIIRYQDLADQLVHRPHTWARFSWGVLLFELGLAKKVLLANPCGFVANQAFQAGALEWGTAWWGLLAYSLQIYFDFSGYSDMAMGLGGMFGFTFPQNFRSPYQAESLTDFWRRWHITLSTFLREYLYVPLGGNRLGARRACLNVFVVMVLGGLWHGAAWNFVAWGAFHGLLLAAERWWGSGAAGKLTVCSESPKLRTLWRYLRGARTLVLVACGWVLFRATDLGHAGSYFAALLGVASPPPAAALLWGTMFQPYHILMIAAAAGITLFCPTAVDFCRKITPLKVVWAAGLFCLSIVFLATQQYNPFIYFLF